MADERTYGFNKSDATDLLNSIGSRESWFPETRPRGSGGVRAVITDAGLAVATDSKTGATSCLATVLAWSTVAEAYTETTRQITVWNHSETAAFTVNTFGWARIIDGHYWFFGDCSAMGSR